MGNANATSAPVLIIDNQKTKVILKASKRVLFQVTIKRDRVINKSSWWLQPNYGVLNSNEKSICYSKASSTLLCNPVVQEEASGSLFLCRRLSSTGAGQRGPVSIRSQGSWKKGFLVWFFKQAVSLEESKRPSTSQRWKSGEERSWRQGKDRQLRAALQWPHLQYIHKLPEQWWTVTCCQALPTRQHALSQWQRELSAAAFSWQASQERPWPRSPAPQADHFHGGWMQEDEGWTPLA